MARTDPQVNFRIPADLKEKLEDAANKNNRTITAELILRLESTFKDSLSNDEKQNLMDEYMRRFENIAPLMQDVFESIKEIPNIRSNKEVIEKLDKTIDAIENVNRVTPD